MKTEIKYEELKKLGQQLGQPVFEAFWTLEVFAQDGRLIQRHRQRSHSWVRNAYNALFSLMAGKDLDDITFGAGKLCNKNTTGGGTHGNYPFGVETTVDGTARGYRAAAGEDLWGIVIGSGTDDESFEGYALATQISDGTGAGQMSYVESEAHSITYTAGTLTLQNELARYFNNNSGDTITVNEVGLVFHPRYPEAEKALMARDKLATGVNVPDTGQLKVTYTISLVYAG